MFCGMPKCSAIFRKANGRLMVRLKNLTKIMNLEKIINFHGFVPKHRDVIRLVKSSQIFCLPSAVEGFGIATIEAMASGVPVVVADTPSNQEVTQRKGALFFEPHNYRDLAQKIIYLLSHKNTYQRLTTQAVSAVKRYDWEIIYRQTEKLYANLCAN